MGRLVIIGSGGHARVLADIAARMELDLAGFIAPPSPEHRLKPVLGDDDWLEENAAAQGISHFIVGMGSVKGGAGLRAKLFARHNAYLSAQSLIHPTAIVADSVAIGPGSAVMAGAILNPGVTIGKNAIINTGAIIDHDGQIGDHVHIAPGCTLSGDVHVGSASLVGVGSAVRQGVRIGDNATIGAGSAVVSDIPEGAVAFGNPARVRG